MRYVRIFFDSPTFDRITKDRAAKFTDMLSAIGGTMGLLTGFSIISGVEIVYFVGKFIFKLAFRNEAWINAYFIILNVLFFPGCSYVVIKINLSTLWFSSIPTPLWPSIRIGSCISGGWLFVWLLFSSTKYFWELKTHICVFLIFIFTLKNQMPYDLLKSTGHRNPQLIFWVRLLHLSN